VEERTAAVKDMETVLKVHDKTAAEILRRIQAVESNLLTRTPEIEEMQARLDRYAQSMGELETQTGRVDANLTRLKEEAVFIDRVTQRIKGAGDQMTALEQAFVQIRQEFADVNQKDLETIRRNAMEVFERETLQYVQQLRDAQKQVEGFQAFAAEAEGRLRDAADQTARELDDRADQTVQAAEQSFARTAREAGDLSSAVFVKLEDRIAAEARETEARLKADLAAQESAVREGVEALVRQMAEVDQRVADGTARLDQLLAQVRSETDLFRDRTNQDLAGLQDTVREAGELLRQDFQTEQTQLLAMTAQLKTDLEGRMAVVREQSAADTERLRGEIQKALEEDRAAAQALADETRQFVQGARQSAQEGEQRTFEALEARLRDYEATFAYRYSKMEEAEKDLAALDQNLRQAMERVAERIQKDFSAFDTAMADRRLEEKAVLDREIEASRDALVRLDKDLEELKARAYDNVSEKLQGFEEEFFADLQKRTASMGQSLEEWQATMKTRLEDLAVQTDRDRAEAERLAGEALAARLQELQNNSFAQSDRLERQIHEAQESAAGSVKAFRDELEQARTRLTEELAALEQSLEARIDQDRARAELAAAESLTQLERDLDAKIRALGDEVDQFRTDTKSGIDAAEADLSLWQTKFAQKFKDLDADLGEQYRAFKASLGEKISALTEEYTQQKEELITRSAEDRVALKNDLIQLRTGVDELDANLRSRGQAAAEAFDREYEAMAQDFQKKNRELVSDIENKLRDYRSSVNDTREKAEAMQKKLFGKIEDQVSLITVNIEEVEKRQKAFVAQTKVFERADSLRQELQEAIEDLKGDLARIEVQRKDLFEIEASISRIKKLGDETSDKAAKFAAEKKRIDLMDADFQKILSLSQAMEVRLEQVTTSHDLLQDIQLRIRKLEDYSKDIEVRYDRLEKRREVLDTTTDGVDRNFSLLEKIEKTIRGLDADLKAMPGDIEELKKRLKALAAGKDDADRAVEKLTLLDHTLEQGGRLPRRGRGSHQHLRKPPHRRHRHRDQGRRREVHGRRRQRQRVLERVHPVRRRVPLRPGRRGGGEHRQDPRPRPGGPRGPSDLQVQALRPRPGGGPLFWFRP